MKRTSGKRWISLVLALCLCLLVGCGGKQTGYDPLKGVETRMITCRDHPHRTQRLHGPDDPDAGGL